MSTAIVLGNGNMLVNLDERLHMTDLYWPRVGKNDHLMGHHIRTYFWDYGNLVSFEDHNSFKITPQYDKDSLFGRSIIESEKYGVRILVENTVLPYKDVYIAKYTVTNTWDMKRNLKFFINHDFYIKEHNVGDTACWYPLSNMLFHYKDNTYLGIGSLAGINQYSCGKSHSYYGAGTLPDAKTGKLNFNAIDHGAVESTIGFDLTLDGGAVKSFDYFIVCGKNFSSCTELKDYIEKEEVNNLLEDTNNFWKSYIQTSIDTVKEDNNQTDFENLLPDIELSKRVKDVFMRSIGLVRTQTDNGGAIIASNDSAHIKYRKDTYEYAWMRDGALTISAIDKFGYTNLSEKFFRFAQEMLEPDGYFLHMYNSNGTLGSSWHPWADELGNPQLPIQEDATATVIWALWKFYENNHNHELISDLWDGLIKPAADFLCEYRYTSVNLSPRIIKLLTLKSDKKDNLADCFSNTNLPMPSYDLWEESRGIWTYTCSAVYGGLLGASIMALKLGQHDEAEKYSKAAHEIKNAVLENLWDEKEGHFIHGLYKDYKNNACAKSLSVDASITGIWKFELLPVDDSRVIKTMEWLNNELWNNNNIGGVIRYKDDDYYRRDSTKNGNPWYITTLWFAQYFIKRNEVDTAMKYIKWVIDHVHGTDLMAEQIDSENGSDLSVLPLTWSHAEFIRTVGMLV